MKVNKWLFIILIVSLAFKALGPKFTCLDNIQVSPEIRDRVFDYLNEYDEKTNHSFFRIGLRPIKIKMGHVEYPVLAFARSGFFNCEITLGDNINWNEEKTSYLKAVLLHELAHCYLFDHTKDPNDLMYFEYSSKITEDTLRHFYPKLEERAHL